jgi:hypothetical protein
MGAVARRVSGTPGYRGDIMVWRRASVAVRRVALRTTGLLAVLVGLCAMHALGTPAAMTSAGSGSQDLVKAAHAMVAVEPLTDPGMLMGFTPDDSGAQASADDGNDMSMSAMGLCLVLLVLGVGAAAWVAHRRGWRGLRWAWPPRRGEMPTRGRAPDPPSLLVLSVCRC